MKNINKPLLAIFLLSGHIAYSQTPVQIKGSFNTDNSSNVKLFKIERGDMKEIASTLPQVDSKFGFTFYPEYDGFYAIGTGNPENRTNNFVFYFKAGDQMDFVISKDGFDLIGNKNSKENQVLAKWQRESRIVEGKSHNWMRIQSNFVDFFPDLEVLNEKSKNFPKENRSGNAKFDNILPTYIKWDIASSATNFLNTPRTVHPSNEEYTEYYKTIDLIEYSKNASIVYNMPWGNRTLKGVEVVTKFIKNSPSVRGINSLKNDLEMYSNDTLKGDVVINYLARQRDYSSYREGIKNYGNLLITSNQEKRASEIMTTMAQLKPGDEGLDFSFEDKEGKMVKFSDFKNKVVLIDVWATWCGPCKEQIPYLKKLEEELKGKDIQIVSISVDVLKDKGKWSDMVKAQNLGGVQLFASGWGEFTKYYKIQSIPRFMVFDKNGKIVTVNSPRPSSSELKQLLEKLLSEKS